MQKHSNNKVEPCEVCGSNGNAKYIATCDQCDSSHVHQYCVKDFQDVWICEECSKKVNKDPDDSRKCNSSRKQSIPERRKVKFISAEEAIKLSSGAFKDSSNSKSRVTSSPGSSRSVVRGRHIWPPQAKTTNRPSVLPVERQEPHTHVNMQAKPLKSRQAPQLPKEPKSPQAHMLRNTHAEPPSYSCKPADKVGTFKGNKEGEGTIAETEEQSVGGCKQSKAFSFSNTRITKVMDRPRSMYSNEEDSPQTGSSEGVGTIAETEEQSVGGFTQAKAFAFSNMRMTKVMDRTRSMYSNEEDTPQTGSSEATKTRTGTEDSPTFVSTLKKYSGYFPAAAVSWKGGFYICDFPILTRFYELKAVTPCRVKRQIYDLLPKLQTHLLVQFVPRIKLWEDLFLDDCPSLDDVGLYFYPSDNDSLKRKFSILYDLMESKDLMIQGYIHNVELLVYTSKQLSLHSQDIMKRIGNESFLCGIFRKTKQNPNQAHSKYVHDPTNKDNIEVIDMEIDMIGGKDVGIVDVVRRLKQTKDRTVKATDCTGMTYQRVEKSSKIY